MIGTSRGPDPEEGGLTADGRKKRYCDFCPDTPELGRYVQTLDGTYNPRLIQLFGACSTFGYRRSHGGAGNGGMLAVIGEVGHLTAAIGRSAQLGSPELTELVGRYGTGILDDPEKLVALLIDIGDIDGYDGAVMFNPDGDLFAIGQHINGVDIDRVSPEAFARVRQIKRNGHPGTTAERHLSALYITGILPVEAVATSEEMHTTVAIRDGDALPQLVFDPQSGLYGHSLFRHLGLQIPESALTRGGGEVVSGV